MLNKAVIDGITVGGQPSRDELSGFATVINVRTDGEPGNETKELAKGSGVEYVSVPFTIDTVTPGDIGRIRAAIASATGPVLLHCAAGTRAAVAAGIVGEEQARGDAEGALARVESAGFHVRGTPYEAFVRQYFSRS